jgi:hypothetical protein
LFVMRCKAGDLLLLVAFARGLRTNWFIVGMDSP